MKIRKQTVSFEHLSAWSQYATLAGWIAVVLLAAWSIPQHF